MNTIFQTQNPHMQAVRTPIYFGIRLVKIDHQLWCLDQILLVLTRIHFNLILLFLFRRQGDISLLFYYMKINRSPAKKVPWSNLIQSRMSLDTLLFDTIIQKKVAFQMSPKRRSSIDTYKLKTQPTLSMTRSTTQLSKYQPFATHNNLVFTKVEDEQEILKRYLSRVIVKFHTNITLSFKKLCDYSRDKQNIKTENKLNKWYKRASNIVALNSKINQQKSLWRLRGAQETIQRTSYVKWVNIIVHPQTYLNYQPHYKALLQLESMIQNNNLKKTVYLFKTNEQNKRIKRRYLELANKNRKDICQGALKKLQLLPDKLRSQKYLRILQKIRQFLRHQMNKQIRHTFSIFKQNIIASSIKKSVALHKISKNTFRNMDRLFVKWIMFIKEKKEILKRQKLTLMFKILQNVEEKNYNYIFKGFDPNFSKKMRTALDKLLKNEQCYRKQHLLKTFKKWRSKENKWYQRGARVFSLNTALNNQTSLWRLRQYKRKV